MTISWAFKESELVLMRKIWSREVVSQIRGSKDDLKDERWQVTKNKVAYQPSVTPCWWPAKKWFLLSHRVWEQNPARHRDAHWCRLLSEVSRWEFSLVSTSILPWWYLGLCLVPHCAPASGPQDSEIMDAWFSNAKFEVISYTAWENQHRSSYSLPNFLWDC